MSWDRLKELAGIVRGLVETGGLPPLAEDHQRRAALRRLESGLDEEGRPDRRRVCRALAELLRFENFSHPPPRQTVDDLIDEETIPAADRAEMIDDEISGKLMLDPVRLEPFEGQTPFRTDRATWDAWRRSGETTHPRTRDEVTGVVALDDLAARIGAMLRERGVDVRREVRLRERLRAAEVAAGEEEEEGGDFVYNVGRTVDDWKERAVDEEAEDFDDQALRDAMEAENYDEEAIADALAAADQRPRTQGYKILGNADDVHDDLYEKIEKIGEVGGGDGDGDAVLWVRPEDPEDFRAIEYGDVEATAVAWWDDEPGEWETAVYARVATWPGRVNPGTLRFVRDGGDDAPPRYEEADQLPLIRGYVAAHNPRPWSSLAGPPGGDDDDDSDA